LARTFDVRFAPTAGLTAVLAAPANTLRWKGAGSLSIHPEAITIALKRGLLSWFARDASRRIAAGQLREVYREGAALRLEFSSPGNAREVLPLWANDREAAAEIVRLLPTSRTVEVEQAPDKRTPRFRPDTRAIGWLLGIAVVIAGGIAVVQRERIIPAPTAAAPAVAEPVVAPAPVPAVIEIPPPDTLRVEGPVVPIQPGSPAYGKAVAQLTRFQTEAAALLVEYQLYRSQLETDALTTEGFIAKLEGSIESGWWTVTFRILEEPTFDDPALVGLRATELAAARHWRAFLDLYVEGLKKNDEALITRAFVLLRRAEWMQWRATQYVRVSSPP
jgi:hypothetical protein